MVWRRDSHFTHCPRLSSDLCCCGNKFVAVPDGLELLRNGELRLRVRERNVWLLHKVWKKLNSNNINKRISARVLNVFSAHSWKDTYKLSVFVGYQDVHLRALGADDLTVQRIVAQVDMATIGLVDGDGGHFTHDLKNPTKCQISLWTRDGCWSPCWDLFLLHLMGVLNFSGAALWPKTERLALCSYMNMKQGAHKKCIDVQQKPSEEW